MKIEEILVSTTKYAFESGKFRRFKVESRMTASEPWKGTWKVCKGEHSMTGSYSPHKVKCDTPTVAKYIRLSVTGGTNLYLTDVRVLGTVIDAGKGTANKS